MNWGVCWSLSLLFSKELYVGADWLVNWDNFCWSLSLLFSKELYLGADWLVNWDISWSLSLLFSKELYVGADWLVNWDNVCWSLSLLFSKELCLDADSVPVNHVLWTSQWTFSHKRQKMSCHLLRKKLGVALTSSVRTQFQLKFACYNLQPIKYQLEKNLATLWMKAELIVCNARVLRLSRPGHILTT
jgi:hypothetical protein